MLSGHIAGSQIDVVSFLVLCDTAADRIKEILTLVDRVDADLLRLSWDDFWDTQLSYASQATEILEFQPHVVPWMAQVPDYTNSLVSWSVSAGAATDSGRLFGARRQAVRLLRQPAVSLLLHESTLRAPFCSTEMIAEQLDHLLLVSAFPEVTINVIPMGVPVQAIGSAFSILSFLDSDPIVCREEFDTGFLLSDKSTVNSYRTAFRRLVRDQALDDGHSRELITAIAAEFAADATRANRQDLSLPTMP